MEIKPVEFEYPHRNEFPAQFTGYVAIGFACGRWWSGADPDSKLDAFQKMQDAARLALIPAAQVETGLDVEFYPSTVKVFYVDSTAEPLPDSI